MLLGYPGWLLRCCYAVARVPGVVAKGCMRLLGYPGWLLRCCYVVARVPEVVAKGCYAVAMVAGVVSRVLLCSC